ncbi:cytochrome P450 [Lactifluus subvellereus]|nr:cytochrome P450 [Lactifluus subvellereus]
MVSLVSVLFAALSSIAALWAICDHRRRGGLPYPPGPRSLPIIGNLLDIPKEFSWLAYTRFSKKHGSIMSFHVFGKVIIVLNTAKAAKDLLEKRGDICSDRPVITFFDMMGWQWNVSTARYTESYRLARKLLDRGLRLGAVASYRQMQQARARVLLTRLLTNPNNWETHIELFQGELILAMTYGYEVCGPGDKKIEAAKAMSKFGARRVLPGALLVNELPFRIASYPEWLPWFSYKPLARIGYNLGQEVLYEPIRFVKESMLSGTAQPSLALENFQEMENLCGPDRDRIEKAAIDLVEIALCSWGRYRKSTQDYCELIGALKTLLLAMLLYPDIQKKAQDELDVVTGRERLPTFEDRPRLPFVDAVCKEVLRWRPVTPLALPHAVTEDNTYGGFFIPKGAIVIGNTWAILHDPGLYPEPDDFKPERFLNPDGSLRDDPILTSAFGFGRRICPGRHFVDATLFIVVASLISVINVEKGRDAKDGPLSYTFTGADHACSRPNSFPCSIVPRDKKSEELIIADAMGR